MSTDKPPIPEPTSKPQAANPWPTLWQVAASRPYLWVIAVFVMLVVALNYDNYRHIRGISLTDHGIIIRRDRGTDFIHINR